VPLDGKSLVPLFAGADALPAERASHRVR
jgi:hypothetical protein